MGREYGLYINGKWVTPKRPTFVSENPATGETLATFPKAKKEEVDLAVAAAKKALPGWKATPGPKRGEILYEVARILRRRKEELGRIVTTEMGKIIAEGRGDVQESIDFIEYIAGEGRRSTGETTTSELRQKFCMWIRQPKGVVACITPWNFPTAIPMWKIGAAVVTGNTVVFKPASFTPLCGARLVEIYEEAGLPPGVLNFVTGSGGEVGDPLVQHPDVAHVSFTGGAIAGKDVYVRAATRLASCELELGGKNPIIVMDDADLGLVMEGALFGAFGTAGQRCTAASRLIVHEKVFDSLVPELVEKARKLKVGNPIDPKTDMGPVVSADQKRTVLDYVAIGRKEAKLLCGGGALGKGEHAKGHFVEPTIFEAKHGTRISKEEIFGPVLTIVKIKDFEEAVHVANDIDYGLSSSIYTRDVNLAFRAIEELETGITYVNAPTIGAEVQLPFGGVKNTGNGGREAGSVAIEEFTEIKSVFIDYSQRLQKAQIE